MQDGVPSHIANPVKRLFSMHFGNDRIISHHFRTNWPPRYPDLNSWDFWVLGYLKHVVFSGPIANLDELNTRIAQHIHNIRTRTLRPVVKHAIPRFELVAENGGKHIEHFLSLSWGVDFQLRVTQMSNDLEAIVLFIDLFQQKTVRVIHIDQ
ncbi:hypothetical protein AVEN_152987-1 [Araneus ventricosus]|uniref:Tc1-like transposase DDE domain-containing protein n=1 Tax=Araneus ventricosus TaxID=182803 RepID=A0A4Y2AD48_ARAVE|nr:hypothetical protein AVEN_152987-1 [Araneus ventricosus]